MNTKIELGQVVNLGITASSVSINDIKYDMISGDWSINISFNIINPTRNSVNDNTIRWIERHILQNTIIVTGAEIASEANLPEGVAASTLSGQDLQAYVMSIATRKMLVSLS